MLMVTLQLSEKWGLKLNIPRHEKFSFCVHLYGVCCFQVRISFFDISRGPAWATVLKSSSLNRAASSANSCESISRRSEGIWDFFLARNVEALSCDFVCQFFIIETWRATTLCVLPVGDAMGSRGSGMHIYFFGVRGLGIHEVLSSWHVTIF